jgi:6-methylsalicylate decarboxylase
MHADIHQHAWPPALVAALRRRREPPLLDEWTLRLPGEPDFLVSPADHDMHKRADLAAADGADLVLLSLSSPLGIENLPYDESAPLLDAFHEGALALPSPFGVWACVNLRKPDPGELSALIKAGCAGLQLPATALSSPAKLAELLPLLEVLERLGKPLFIHPGPVTSVAGTGAPAWWPPIVPYVTQMHTAWFSYRACAETALPRLRVCFAMLAGLAPLHDERCAARGGPASANPLLYLDTSSYGPRAITAAAQVMGAAAIVNGSDRPYAAPPRLGPGPGLREAACQRNPARLLGLGG